MQTVPQDSAKSSHVIVHRHMQRRFNDHRAKFEAHKKKGGVFAAALEQLEKHLFG